MFDQDGLENDFENIVYSSQIKEKYFEQHFRIHPDSVRIFSQRYKNIHYFGFCFCKFRFAEKIALFIKENNNFFQIIEVCPLCMMADYSLVHQESAYMDLLLDTMITQRKG